ncbi:MAG: zinc ribbon domain-containing protein [Chitinophagaceae bacterium]
MYCAICGKPVSGNFCANCGTPVAGSSESKPPTSTLHWEEETTIPALLANPEVATLIKYYAGQAEKKLDADDYLSIFDTIMKPGGISLKKLADISVPIFEKMGVNTAHSTVHTLPFGLHESIIRCVCAIAKEGLPVSKIDLAENGLVLVATIPSDLWSWAGEMAVTIEALGTQTQVNIHTVIKGQLYDWGKSNRRMERLIADMEGIQLTD